MVNIALKERSEGDGYYIIAGDKTYKFVIKDGLMPDPILMKGISLIYAIGAFDPFPNVINKLFPETIYLYEYITTMCKAMGQGSPTIITESDPKYCKTINKPDNKVVVAGSGGKDTLYILLKCIEEFGKKNVYPVHIRGITKSYTKTEEAAMWQLCEALGLPLEVVTITNSLPRAYTENPSRNQVITGLLIPYLIKHNASHIAFGVPQDEKHPQQVKPYLFYETLQAEKLFEKFVYSLGYNVTMHRPIAREEAIYEWLVKEHEPLLQLTTSCFQPDRFKTVRRGHNLARYRFPLYDTQCGLCEKCIRINTARLAFDDNIDAGEYQNYIRVMLAYAKRELNKLPDTQTWSRRQWEWCIGHLEKFLKGSKLIQHADTFLDSNQTINVKEDEELW